jgi:PAS domain S-box-containing protein
MSSNARQRQDPRRELGILVSSVKDYAIFTLDPDGRITSWNDGARAIKGYEEHEILGEHLSRFYTPEDNAAGRPARLLNAAVLQGRIEDEGWRVRRDGSRFWADVVITAVRDEAREVVGFVKVTRDLSDRKQAEDLLRQSEQRLKQMIESVKDYALFMLDPDGRVASWNAGAQRLNGYSAPEIIGQHFSRFYPDVEVERGVPGEALRTAAAQERAEDEGWRLRKDGSQFWASVVINAVRNEQGELIGYTQIVRDVSERRRAQEELAVRARQQATVAQLGVYALRSTDLQALLDEAVKQVATTLHAELVSTSELQAEQRMLLIRAGAGWQPGLVGRVLVPVEEGSLAAFALQAGTPVVIEDLATETRFVAPEILRSHQVVSGITAPIDLPDGAGPFGVLGVYSRERQRYSADDLHFVLVVTSVLAGAIMRQRTGRLLQDAEQTVTDERLRAAQAHEALRERDEFISVAAHELRTPLTALQLKLQGLERILSGDVTASKRSGAGVGERLGDALRQTHRLTELVERLLDVSRIVTGRLDLWPEELDLGTLVSAVIGDFREQALQANSEISLSISGDARGTWDRHRLEQVVANLLSNALKYGGQSPIEVTVEGSTRVRLAVKDRGIGISQGDVERIFGRFERAASLRHYGGLGLGLYIAGHIVQAHGGAIQVSTEEGKGSTFVVELPRKPPFSSVGRPADETIRNQA